MYPRSGFGGGGGYLCLGQFDSIVNQWTVDSYTKYIIRVGDHVSDVVVLQLASDSTNNKVMYLDISNIGKRTVTIISLVSMI